LLTFFHTFIISQKYSDPLPRGDNTFEELTLPSKR
jgi:hypothetical protein